MWVVDHTRAINQAAGSSFQFIYRPQGGNLTSDDVQSQV